MCAHGKMCRLTSIVGITCIFLATRTVIAGEQYGAQRTTIDIGKHKGFILQPAKSAAEGARPWVWYAPTIGSHPNQSNGWVLRKLLERGFYVCGVDVGESYGSPAGRRAYTEFHQHVVREYKLESKARLLAQSRGGLMLYNWAAENPDKVRCIVGIYPVCDLRSYPGLKNAAVAYGMTPAELEKQLSQHNPIDRLEPLAKAGVPILHVHGNADVVVPLEKNSQVVLERYTALSGKMKLIVVPGKGHAEIPEYFQEPRLVQFLSDGGFSQTGNRSDTEHIDSQPNAGTSAAVIVADSVPLIHTQQILAEDSEAKPVQSVRKRLQAILNDAGSSLDRMVKLNFVLSSDEQQEALRNELARWTFGNAKPAVSFVTGKLPKGASWAVDAVALGTRRPAWKQVEHGDGFAILPPGTRVYVSGQAVGGKDLAEATRKTLAELRETLKYLGLKETSVVQLKVFLQPMAQHKIVQEEMANFFGAARATVPPLVLIEWQSSLSIEIELIAWGGRERAGEPIEFLTPPGMKASPVYSRVARVNDGKLIYLSSFHGKAENNPAAEIPDIFEQMGKVLEKAGSNFSHLAKATYYVTSPQATKTMGEVRPRYYDPKRPPSASLAMVSGTGRAHRTVTMDMIAVPSPRVKVNEYGPAERGHGLSEADLREGFFALFDGKTTFGWSGAQVKDGILLEGQSNFMPGSGAIRFDVAKPGTLGWVASARIKKIGPTGFDTNSTPELRMPIRLKDGLQLRSIHFKPRSLADISPRMIGADWKPINHPKLTKERHPIWTVKDGILSAIGGPGCLEYQKEQFANFILQMEVRTKVRRANSGVFFRAIPGSFMNGYEAQVYNRCHDGDVARPWTWATGAIDDRQNVRRLVSRDGEWFHYTILAAGDRLVTWVNGQQTVDWQDDRKEHENPRLGKRTAAGTLQLQAHDAGTEVEFRNIRIAAWK